MLNNLPYGERFRKHRKWIQDAFTSKSVLEGYRPIQRRETYTLLAGLCMSPEHVLDHVKRYGCHPSWPPICVHRAVLPY